MPDATTPQVPEVEEIPPGSPPSEESPGQDADSERRSLEEELERNRQERIKAEERVRAFQAEKDRLAAENKRLQQAGMTEQEILKDENEELKRELERERQFSTYLSFQEARRTMAEKYKIPSEFYEFLNGNDEMGLESSARKLAALLKERGVIGAAEQPPNVPSGAGGVPTREAEEEIDDLLKQGKLKEAINKRLFGAKR